MNFCMRLSECVCVLMRKINDKTRQSFRPVNCARRRCRLKWRVKNVRCHLESTSLAKCELLFTKSDLRQIVHK